MANDKKDLTIRINGVRVVFPDQQPEIDSAAGRTLIPLRGGFDAIGFDVTWNDGTKTAIIKNSKYKLEFKIGVKEYSITDLTTSTKLNPKDLDVAPKISELKRMMIPLRGPLEEIGCKIEYIPNESIAHIENRRGPLKLLVETDLKLRKGKKTASGGEIPDTSSNGVIDTLAKGTVLTTSNPVDTYNDDETIPYIKVVHGGKSGWVAIRKRDTKEEYLVIKTSGGGQGGQVEGPGNEDNYSYVDIPQDDRKLGTIISYMGWHQITGVSDQLTLKNNANTNGRYSIGAKPKYYAMIDGRMLIATKKNIGGLLEVSIGDYLDVLFEASDGTRTTYKCIAGDVKEAGAESSPWGHYDGQGVVEIIYNSYTPPAGYDSVNIPQSAGNNPWGKGKVLRITIVGNYYDN